MNSFLKKNMRKILLIIILVLNVTALLACGVVVYVNLFAPVTDTIKEDIKPALTKKAQKAPDTAEKAVKKKEIIPEKDSKAPAAVEKTVKKKSVKPKIDAEKDVSEKKTVVAQAPKEAVPGVKESAKKPTLVNIKSEPEQAKVFVNGYYKGKTPIEFKITSIKEKTQYNLVVMKVGYTRWEQDVVLDVGDTMAYEVVLKEEK